MARMNLKLKTPVTDFDFDVDENSLESNGWVRIVRCKDCKHRTETTPTKWHPCVDMAVNNDWFCADGEREVHE